MFTGEELMKAIRGQEEGDWNFWEWVETAQYENYTPDEPTIVYFWRVFLDKFTHADRKKFLLFLTGSDRIPFGGVKYIHFKISKSVDYYKLPWVSTCANILFLPNYGDEEVLEKKLKQAIYGSEGFDFI